MGNKWCMGGKRLDKNSMRISKRAALLFENVRVSGALQDFANSWKHEDPHTTFFCTPQDAGGVKDARV